MSVNGGSLGSSPSVNGHASRALSFKSPLSPSVPPTPSSLHHDNNNSMEPSSGAASTSAATTPEQQVGENSEVDAAGNNGLTALQSDRVAIFETSEELQELCRDNGLSANQFARKSATVAMLDMFRGFWSSMKTVMYFPALRELSIIKHPTIAVMEGLSHCPNLEILCITECGIERIADLEKCKKIQKLNLSSNKIQRIEQLDDLMQLEILWLNDNQIDSLDGLWRLTQLKQLWACRNKIERLDSTLSCCVSLTELNLADNRLCNFKSLLSLTNLDQLSILTLSDPHFGDNPVCKLCNYQTYLMCHLSRLTCLDTVELSTRNKQIAEATMIKKKMYYNMRIKAIKRDIRARIKHTENIRNQAEQQIEFSLAALVREKKEIERYIADLSLKEAKGEADHNSGCQATQDLTKKLECVNSCLKSKYSTIYRMNYEFDRLRANLQSTSDINISRLLLELETGGNIRLEDGKPSDVWFVSCVDLVHSRLFPAELRSFGVQDIRINRVTRINNRYLRHRFLTRMEEIVTVPEHQLKDNVSKKGVTVPMKEPEDQASDADREKQQLLDKYQTDQQANQGLSDPDATLESSLEYLLYVQPPHFDCQRRNHEMEQFFAAENGFREPAEYARMGIEGAIKLSNSIALLDSSRLAAALAVKGKLLQRQQAPPQDLYRLSSLPIHQQKDLTKEMKDALQLAASGEWELPSGVLLVVKVFPGYTKCVPEEKQSSSALANASVSRVNARDYLGLQSVQVPFSPLSGSNDHSSTAKQKFYYIFDKALVLPEYLVEYQYTLADSIAVQGSSNGNPLGLPGGDLNLQSPSVDTIKTPRKLQAGTDAEATDFGVATKLVEDFERRYRIRRPSASSESFSHGDDGVTRVLHMKPILPCLGPVDNTQVVSMRLNAAEMNKMKHLNLMGCGLESIPDLACVKDQLEVLVLSYNNIQSVNQFLCGLNKLRSLDLSFNQLTRLEHLDQCESLHALEANSNQLRSFEDVEYLGRSFQGRALTHLDLRKNAVCGTKRYRLHVLQHLLTLECLDQRSVTKDESLSAQQLITKLSAAKVWDYFYRMKVISIPFGAQSDAAGEKTAFQTSNDKPEYDEDESEGGSRSSCLPAFQPCWNALEELSLNRELIGEIEGFDNATNLRVATFADNVIKRISGLSNCSKLEELSLEDNEITRVENLDSLVSLKKLHLGRNQITMIERLDMLENLTQLSLEENQITSLRGLGSAHKLMELYIGSNRIEILKEIQHLKTLPKLTILDLSGNDITRLPDYRLYAVYYLRRVKVLDGLSISPQDQSDAKQKYSGKLTMEFILEKCVGASGNSSAHNGGSAGASSFNNPLDRIQEMDLSSCRIREIGSIPGKVFANVRELNLENNQISEILGLETLPKLRILNLNRNRIEKLLPTSSSSTFTVPEELEGKGILACLNLEQLYLAYNQINDMTMLGLQFLDDLKVLHLQGNAIVFFAGLDSNTELRELRLDKNRIRQLESNATIALRQLRILTLEDNGMKSLSNLNNLLSLEVLDLSNNRLIDLEEVDRLSVIPAMIDLRLTNNPLTKKHLYRQTVIYKLSFVRSLDNREISADERERVGVLFVHERAAAAALSSSSSSYSNNSTERYIETRSYGTNGQISLTPSSIPSKSSSSNNNSNNASAIAMATSATRASIPQLSTGEVLAGSLLRKYPLSNAAALSHNQFPSQQQSVNSFPKPDQSADSGIAIVPSNTRGLLVHSQAVSYRNPNSLTNQANAMMIGSVGTGGQPPSSSTVTVASAFGAALANGLPTDHFHLGGLRSDRRRMSSVHYDQSFNAMQIGNSTSSPLGAPAGLSISNELKFPVGIVSSHAVIRGPASLTSQGSGSVHKPTPASLGMMHNMSHTQNAEANSGASGGNGSTRSFSGNVVSSFANQKRYPAYQDFHPDATIPYLSSKLNQIPGRHDSNMKNTKKREW